MLDEKIVIVNGVRHVRREDSKMARNWEGADIPTSLPQLVSIFYS